MQGSTVRIDSESRETLRELAEQENESMTTIIQRAIEEYRRKLFLRRCAEAYSRLGSDKRAQKREAAEREEWDNTLVDGLKGTR